MLIEFRVSNYRSIGEEQVLSLVPAPKQKEYLDNIIRNGKHEALNVVALYGANASGKSNLLKAMNTFSMIISFYARFPSTYKLPYEPFLLREGWNKKPTCYEIVFLIGESRYRYGFEFNQLEIVSEWLFKKSSSREVNLFQRSRDVIDVSSALKGSKQKAIETTKDNALFLSYCDIFKIEEGQKIINWLQNFIIVDGLKTEDEVIGTFKLFDDPIYRQKIKGYLTALNIGIVDLEVVSKDFDESELGHEIPEEFRNVLISSLTGKKGYSVDTMHHLYDQNGKKTSKQHIWKLEEKESSGTIKAFHLSGPVIWALMNGGVLIIDEIEAKMHPIMTLQTINMFLNKEINTNNAQLIFATHDTNLLSYAKLRRDQIYFAEKNEWESTEFYSLSDFVFLDKNGSNLKSTRERPDADKEKRYFEGRYGAIPVLGNFNIARSKENGNKW
ncbi:ATP-binding protein [Pseudanabaena galeata UHCC 0370]|uniref:ATP-binding protein n=1 Tax=Pseudanabaena galeata UHCC 0370 TaxID=3110310 RepID=A0ABU5TMQ8_9CYAN|nr:ATP-binding protein [Pseudanabaena galeata]MEA5479555.1 ATP-binding protein [Pseudanabaena galeata UHCC 0370]